MYVIIGGHTESFKPKKDYTIRISFKFQLKETKLSYAIFDTLVVRSEYEPNGRFTSRCKDIALYEIHLYEA